MTRREDESKRNIRRTYARNNENWRPVRSNGKVHILAGTRRITFDTHVTDQPVLVKVVTEEETVLKEKLRKYRAATHKIQKNLKELKK